MSRMIPQYVHSGTTSGGEKRLFEVLKTAQNTDHWIVLHSVGLARHASQLTAEMDFVVIVPMLGVLCIEVKANQVVCEDGMWRYVYGTEAQSPFTKCASTMHALQKAISQKDSGLRGVLFCSAVFFTDVDIPDSLEWEPWQNAGVTSLGGPSCSLTAVRVREILTKAHSKAASLPADKRRWYQEVYAKPSSETCQKIVSILRPRFEVFVSPSTAMAQLDQQMVAFTEEQYRLLDLVQEHPRKVFQGAAGTGKTMMAIEATRRELSAGRKTALLCYNRLLGSWLKRQAEPLTDVGHWPPTAKLEWVGTFSAYLVEMGGNAARVALSARGNDPTFWSKELPEMVLGRLNRSEIPREQLDSIVVDEAQDLCSDTFLCVLDALLKGGFDNGRYVFFGDFERQAIYFNNACMELWRGLIGTIPPFRLTVNCRNTQETTGYIETLCHLQPPYTPTVHALHGPVPVFEWIHSPCASVPKLREVLDRLDSEGVPRNDVVILSPKSGPATALDLRSEGDKRLSPVVDPATKGYFQYCTIHAFKGMEARIVIVTDIESVEGDHNQAMLYLAMSRAKYRLHLLVSESARPQLQRIINAGT